MLDFKFWITIHNPKFKIFNRKLSGVEIVAERSRSYDFLTYSVIITIV